MAVLAVVLTSADAPCSTPPRRPLHRAPLASAPRRSLGRQPQVVTMNLPFASPSARAGRRCRGGRRGSRRPAPFWCLCSQAQTQGTAPSPAALTANISVAVSAFPDFAAATARRRLPRCLALVAPYDSARPCRNAPVTEVAGRAGGPAAKYPTRHIFAACCARAARAPASEVTRKRRRSMPGR